MRNRFAWVPKYPGATMENINSKQSRDELSYGFNFHTPDDFKKVLTYYRDQLQSAGFQVDLKETTTAAGELHATVRQQRSHPRRGSRQRIARHRL